MRTRLETKSTAKILKFVDKQLKETMLEHQRMDHEVASALKAFEKESKASTAKPGPSFYVEGIHFSVDITSDRHHPGKEPQLSVRISKSY